MRRNALLTAVVLLTACGPDLEVSDPVISAVCLNNASLSFAGTIDGVTASASFDLTLVKLDIDAIGDSRVTLSFATMTADGDLDDLRFAERVRISILGAATGSVDIANAPAGGSEIELPGDPKVDLAAYLRDGADSVEIAVTGNVPTTRWQMRINLCFDVEPDEPATAI